MRNKKNSAWKRFGIIALVICMFGLVLFFNRQIEETLNREMQMTLRDVARQNSLVVNKELEARYRLLESAAEQLDGKNDDIERFLKDMEQMVEVYQFKRIGFIYPDGIGRTTDGWVQDLSFRPFFQEALSGKRILTDVLIDSIGEEKEPINVFCVPVYEEDEVIGVLFATYRTENFQQVMGIQCYDGEGYGCIIDKSGSVIVNSANEKFQAEENFLNEIKEKKENIEIAEKIEQAISKGESLFGTYTKEHEEFFYLEPLSEEADSTGWYMMTIVPVQVLEERLNPIISRVNLLVFLLIVVGLAGVVMYLYSFQTTKKKLYELAYMDRLTKGTNFEYLLECLEDDSRKPGYLIAMDIIGFKIINSTCGVETGDRALCEIRKVLDAHSGEREIVARVNGDRYALFWYSQDKEELERRLEMITHAIDELSGKMNIPSLIPSFGIYRMEKGENLTESYSRTVEAKALIKGRRDKNYAFYEEVDKEEEIRRRAMEDRFETALQTKEFEVWYQPKFGVSDFGIVGAEALIRWREEDGTLIPPGRFIPLFEKNGMISKLDEYTFREVCRQQKKWEDEGRILHPISVNISRASLYFDNIVERYCNILDEYHLDTRYVELEITESAIIDNARISQLIEKFHQAGFHMLLDDFGNGYSSLSSLNMLHFDTLKLDKSLVDYVGDQNGETLLFYITKLAQNLGLCITAEGVETKEQVEYVKKLQCTDIQGFYFSKPLPVEEFEKMM